MKTTQVVHCATQVMTMCPRRRHRCPATVGPFSQRRKLHGGAEGTLFFRKLPMSSCRDYCRCLPSASSFSVGSSACIRAVFRRFTARAQKKHSSHPRQRVPGIKTCVFCPTSWLLNTYVIKYTPHTNVTTCFYKSLLPWFWFTPQRIHLCEPPRHISTLLTYPSSAAGETHIRRMFEYALFASSSRSSLFPPCDELFVRLNCALQMRFPFRPQSCCEFPQTPPGANRKLRLGTTREIFKQQLRNDTTSCHVCNTTLIRPPST